MDFVKLSNLENFTVKNYRGYAWKKWDNENKKMLTADRWSEGFKKMHQLELENEKFMDVSNDQLGQMLVSAFRQNGMATILGQKYNVKTNGQTGMEIRYFLNLAQEPVTNIAQQQVEAQGVAPRTNSPAVQDNYPDVRIEDLPF